MESTMKHNTDTILGEHLHELASQAMVLARVTGSMASTSYYHASPDGVETFARVRRMTGDDNWGHSLWRVEGTSDLDEGVVLVMIGHGELHRHEVAA